MKTKTMCFEEKVGILHARRELDCIIELAIAVAVDSKQRPTQYKEANLPELSAFISKVGTDPDWPDYDQRTGYYAPLFEAAGSFISIQADMLEAARAYAERQVDTGDAMLKQEFVDTAIAYRAGLSTNAGNVVDEAENRTEEIFGKAVAVFKDTGVARAFGLTEVTQADWPIEASPSGNGAVLVGAISAQLPVPANAAATAQQFFDKQLIATRSNATFSKLPNVTDSSQTDDLIGAAYGWYKKSSNAKSRVSASGNGGAETTLAPATRLATNTASLRRSQ